MANRVSVAWTKPALDSLLKIALYIKRDNPSAAQRFAAASKTKVTRLEEFPESGRKVPEFSSSSLRESIAQDYRVIYQIRQNPFRIEILTVRHGARQFGVHSDES